MMPNTDIDPYAVLGVARTATAEEIRAAYRDLVAKYHPDRHQGNPLEDLAAAKVAEINRAYEILSDPVRKAAYDRGGSVWPRPAGFPFGKPPVSGRGPSRLLLLIGLVPLLYLLLRLGGWLVRMMVRLFRVMGEGLAFLRGTPAAMVAVALALVVFVLLLARHRRRRRNRKPDPDPKAN